MATIERRRQKRTKGRAAISIQKGQQGYREKKEEPKWQQRNTKQKEGKRNEAMRKEVETQKRIKQAKKQKEGGRGTSGRCACLPRRRPESLLPRPRAPSVWRSEINRRS
jgi:hypothetical protein